MEKTAFTRWGWKSCEGCGAPVAPESEHACEPERAELFQKHLAMAFAAQADYFFAEFLKTPQGRFAVYYAERNRLRGA